MISDIVLNIIYYFVLGITQIFNALGDVPSDNNITEALTTIGNYIAPLLPYLPLTTILAIIIFEVTFETIYFTYKLIKWGYKKIPGIG